MYATARQSQQTRPNGSALLPQDEERDLGTSNALALEELDGLQRGGSTLGGPTLDLVASALDPHADTSTQEVATGLAVPAPDLPDWASMPAEVGLGEDEQLQEVLEDGRVELALLTLSESEYTFGEEEDGSSSESEYEFFEEEESSSWGGYEFYEEEDESDSEYASYEEEDESSSAYAFYEEQDHEDDRYDFDDGVDEQWPWDGYDFGRRPEELPAFGLDELLDSGPEKDPPPPASPDAARAPRSRPKASYDRGAPNEVDGSDLYDTTLDISDKLTTFGANLNNGGADNSGFNAVGSTKTAISGWSDEQREQWTNGHVSGFNDAVGGVGQTMGGLGGVYGGVSAFREAREKGEHDNAFKAALQTGTGATNVVGGLAKTVCGVQDAVRGEARPDDIGKAVGDTASVVGGVLELGADAISTGQKLHHMSEKDWAHQSASTNLRRVGEGVVHGAKTGKAIVNTAKNATTLIEQARHGGENIASSGAQAAMSEFGKTVVGPVGIAVGGLQLAQQGVKAGKAASHRRDLTRQEQGLDPNDRKQRKKLEAFEHLRENEKKKQKRAAIDGAVATMGIASGACTATGLGSMPGLIIGATAATTKLGQLGVRKGKQALRDKRAERYDDLKTRRACLNEEEQAEYDQMRQVNKLRDLKALSRKERKGHLGPKEAKRLERIRRHRDAEHQSSLTMRERLTLARSVDITRSTDAKLDRNLETVRTILRMPHADKIVALRSLGIDEEKWATIKAENPTKAKQVDVLLKAIKKR